MKAEPSPLPVATNDELWACEHYYQRWAEQEKGEHNTSHRDAVAGFRAGWKACIESEDRAAASQPADLAPPPDTRGSTAEKPDTLKQLRQKLDGLENCVLLSVGWAKDLLDALLEREEAK